MPSIALAALWIFWHPSMQKRLRTSSPTHQAPLPFKAFYVQNIHDLPFLVKLLNAEGPENIPAAVLANVSTILSKPDQLSIAQDGTPIPSKTGSLFIAYLNPIAKQLSEESTIDPANNLSIQASLSALSQKLERFISSKHPLPTTN